MFIVDPGVIHVNDTDKVIASTASHYVMYDERRLVTRRQSLAGKVEHGRGRMPCGPCGESSHVRDAYSSVHATASSYFFLAIPILSNAGNGSKVTTV